MIEDLNAVGGILVRVLHLMLSSAAEVLANQDATRGLE